MSHRLHAVIALPRLAKLALIGATFACFVAAAVPADAANHGPSVKQTSRFLWGLAGEESGWNYYARNRYSGAFGKYQIMPFNWPVWAKRYLGDRKARATPVNQERIAAGKLTDLYRRFGGSWDRTAYWWLTGKHGPPATWSTFASHYVNGVMVGYRMRRATPLPGRLRRLDDSSSIVRYAGSWRIAHHRRYLEGGVHYARTPGAAVGVRFVGRGIRIVGPVGPTRGRVSVWVDGIRVAMVDLGARRFRPRAVLVALDWTKRSEHWVELRVARTPGRPVVAIDRVVIRG